jgi:hypothetical protein
MMGREVKQPILPHFSFYVPMEFVQAVLNSSHEVEPVRMIRVLSVLLTDIPSG